MKLAQSFVAAFSMYSKIPMPQIAWDAADRSYALCFLPLIGVVIGGMLWGWMLLAGALGFGPVLRGVGAALVPIAVSGAIHLDGFCDTIDALSSHQEPARKLEIMKDSHIGAFALIACCAYLLLFCALWSEIKPSAHLLAMLSLGFCLSRSLGGLAAVTFRSAKKNGMLAAFSQAADQRASRVILALCAVSCVTGMIALSPVRGAACGGAALLTFGYFRVMSYRQFGGITGDLAGYFVTLCELVLVGTAVLVGGLLR